MSRKVVSSHISSRHIWELVRSAVLLFGLVMAVNPSDILGEIKVFDIAPPYKPEYTAVLEKANDVYEIKVRLFSPIQDVQHQGKMTWNPPVHVEQNPSFRFSKFVPFRVFIFAIDREQSLNPIVIEVSLGVKKQIIKLNLSLSPPVIIAQRSTPILTTIPPELIFQLDKKRQESRIKTLQITINGLQRGQPFGIDISSDSDEVLQFSTRDKPTQWKKFLYAQLTKDDSSLILNTALRAGSESGSAKITIVSTQIIAEKPVLSQQINVQWATISSGKGENDWKSLWLVGAIIGISALIIILFLRPNWYQKIGSLLRAFIKSKPDKHESRTLEIKLNSDKFTFNPQRPDPQELQITGWSPKILELKFSGTEGLKITHKQNNNDVGSSKFLFVGSSKFLFNKALGEFAEDFTVALDDPDKVDTPLELQFFERNSSIVIDKRSISIIVHRDVDNWSVSKNEDGADPRLDDLIQRMSKLETAVEAMQKSPQSGMQKQHEPEKTKQIKQQPQDYTELASKLVKNQIEPITGQMSQFGEQLGKIQEQINQLKNQVQTLKTPTTQLAISDDSNEDEPSPASEPEPEPEPIPPLDSSALDLKIAAVINALTHIEQRRAPNDVVIVRVIRHFEALQNDGLRGGYRGPDKTREKDFDDLVKAHIPAIIENFDTPNQTLMDADLRKLVEQCGLQEIKSEKGEAVVGTEHEIIKYVRGEAKNRIIAVYKRGFKYNKDVIKKAVVTAGLGE